MNFLKRILIYISLMHTVGCVSGAKRLAELDAAAANPPKLENLCREGINGACALMGKTVVYGPGFSIMQGLTSATESRFTVVVPKKKTFVYYARTPEKILRLNSERVEWRSSPMAVDHIEAFGLQLGKTYELIVVDGEGMAADRRMFRALDVAAKSPRLAVLSCQDDTLKAEQAAMWKQLLEDKPDVVFMIGDNVYADRVPGGWQAASSEQLWDRYVDTRSTLDFYKAKQLIPVIATWDDHDFGRNDSDRTYAFKEESQKAFQAFFNQLKSSGNFARGPGIASAWDSFGLRFVFLDNRSFRSPDRVELSDQSHLGAEQEDWLTEQIKTSRGPLFLISGDQFFGGYHPFESFEGSHPKNFQAQLARWKKSEAPLIFVSGDRHLTEIIQIPSKTFGYPTFELTSSPMHAPVYADAFLKSPSPNQLVGTAGKHNYMLIELKKSAPQQLQLNVRSRGLEQATLYQRTLTVKKSMRKSVKKSVKK